MPGFHAGYPASMTSSSTLTRPPAEPAVRSRSARTFAVLTTLTTLAILLQAVTAGQFVQREGQDSWVTVHGVIADASWVLALITAGYGVLKLRRTHRTLVDTAVVLFIITLAQTGIGHLITDSGQDGWIALHVPLAVVIFGLTGWLTLRAFRATR
jgi:hypothetical protein